MSRIVQRIVLAACLACTIGAAAAQQLNQPASSSRPAAPGSAVVPRSAAPTATRLTAIPSSPGQRPTATSPIPSTGPSTPRPATATMKPVAPVAPTAPVRARDENGRLIPGAVRVSPTRAYDPATGRYHPTVPTGTPR